MRYLRLLILSSLALAACDTTDQSRATLRLALSSELGVIDAIEIEIRPLDEVLRLEAPFDEAIAIELPADTPLELQLTYLRGDRPVWLGLVRTGPLIPGETTTAAELVLDRVARLTAVLAGVTDDEVIEVAAWAVEPPLGTPLRWVLQPTDEPGTFQADVIVGEYGLRFAVVEGLTPPTNDRVSVSADGENVWEGRFTRADDPALVELQLPVDLGTYDTVIIDEGAPIASAGPVLEITIPAGEPVGLSLSGLAGEALVWQGTAHGPALEPGAQARIPVDAWAMGRLDVLANGVQAGEINAVTALAVAPGLGPAQVDLVEVDGIWSAPVPVGTWQLHFETVPELRAPADTLITVGPEEPALWVGRFRRVDPAASAALVGRHRVTMLFDQELNDWYSLELSVTADEATGGLILEWLPVDPLIGGCVARTVRSAPLFVFSDALGATFEVTVDFADFWAEAGCPDAESPFQGSHRFVGQIQADGVCGSILRVEPDLRTTGSFATSRVDDEQRGALTVPGLARCGENCSGCGAFNGAHDQGIDACVQPFDLGELADAEGARSLFGAFEMFEDRDWFRFSVAPELGGIRGRVQARTLSGDANCVPDLVVSEDCEGGPPLDCANFECPLQGERAYVVEVFGCNVRIGQLEVALIEE